MEPMVFEDIAPIQVPVHLGKTRLVLHEATEDAATQYTNAKFAAARFKGGELDRMSGLADVEPLLVSLCLCKTEDGLNAKRRDDGTLVTVPLSFVQQLKPSTVKAMYAKIKEISPDLDEQPESIIDIDKQMAALAKRRDELAKKQTPGNDLPADTTDNSE